MYCKGDVRRFTHAHTTRPTSACAPSLFLSISGTLSRPLFLSLGGSHPPLSRTRGSRAPPHLVCCPGAPGRSTGPLVPHTCWPKYTVQGSTPFRTVPNARTSTKTVSHGSRSAPHRYRRPALVGKYSTAPVEVLRRCAALIAADADRNGVVRTLWLRPLALQRNPAQKFHQIHPP